MPVIECDVVQFHAGICSHIDTGPVMVDVEGLGVAVANEFVKQDIGDGTKSTVGLDHHHLVAIPGVYIAGGDIRDAYLIT